MALFLFPTVGIFCHFCPNKTDLSGNTVDHKLQVIKEICQFDHFWHLNQLLATQNVNVTRFDRNVECDFFL